MRLKFPRVRRPHPAVATLLALFGGAGLAWLTVDFQINRLNPPIPPTQSQEWREP